MLLWDVWLLRQLGVSVDLAVEMVRAKLRASVGWNKSRWPLKEPAHSVLVRKWKEWRDRHSVEGILKPLFETWGQAEIRKYLDQFPTELHRRLPDPVKIILDRSEHSASRKKKRPSLKCD